MIGQVLGHYRIRRELGRGGMATVYLADTPTGEPVAIKVLHPHLLGEPGFFKRFLLEAKIGREIKHPNVVRTLDVDAIEVEGQAHHFLVMEYVEGQTLRSFLDEMGWFPEDLCRHIAVNVANALIAMHSAGLVHRDLKPENVLIAEDETIKVMDLGVARMMDQAVRLSKTGQFVGSLLYAAPEQFRGKGAVIDGRADLYALGMMLYEFSTGDHPFNETEAAAVIQRQLNDLPDAPSQLNPRVSPFLEELVLGLIEKDPENRFASAGALLEALQEGEKSQWWRARSRAIRAKTRRPLRRIRIPRETELHGRQREMDALLALWADAKEGEAAVILLEGEAGIGKSRLVDEFVGRVEAEGENFNFLFGCYPPGGAATAAGAFSTAYREHLGAEGLTAALERYLTVTPLLVPGFAAQLSGEPPPEGMEPLNKDSIQTVFAYLTRGLAAERPTVVLIDDLHFAPEEGLALFASLSLAVPGHRILLIGATRPGLSPEWSASLDRLPHIHHLVLERLGFLQLRALLEESLESEQLAEDLSSEITRRSDGNPFFVFEILHQLRQEERLIQRSNGRWSRVGEVRDLTIPFSVKDLVQARISRLEDEDRDLLEVAACVGFEFDPLLVTGALGVGRIPTLKRLGRLERQHRLVHSCGRRFVFDHHQVQESLYDGLSELLREELHARLGEVLERQARPAEGEEASLSGHTAVELCEHFLRGGRRSHAVVYLEPALDHLSDGMQVAQAAHLAERCLEESEGIPGPTLADVLFRLAGWMEHQGRREDEARRLTEAIEVADREGEIKISLQARIRAGFNRRATGRIEEAIEILEEALCMAREAGERAREAEVYSALAAIQADQGRYDEAKKSYESHRRTAREAGDTHGEAGATGNLALVAWEMTQFDESLRLFKESLALFRKLGRKRGEASAIGNMGLALNGLGRFEEALTCFERHRDLSRELGYRRGEVMALGNLGVTYGALGLLAKALQSLEADLDIGPELGNPMHVGITNSLLGGLFTELGAFSRAHQALDEALTIFEGVGYRMGLGDVWEYQANLAKEEARTDEAERLLFQTIELRDEMGAAGGVAELRFRLGGLYVGCGESDRAREQLELSLAAPEEDCGPGCLVLANCLLAVVTAENVDGAREALRKNADLISIYNRMEANYFLYQAAGEEEDIVEARRLLDYLVKNAPVEYQETMVGNIAVCRGILMARP
jgi:tetratricopeptide (TPR) repeat protein